MPTVWIGAAGTATAYGLISAIRRAWSDSVRIVAADINPPVLVASASLADETVVIPPLVDPAFEPELIDGLARTGADTYVPILDREVVIAARLRDAGRLPDRVRYVKAPSTESALVCLDKLETYRLLARHGLSTPRTWGHQEVPRDGQPLMIKPRCGVGSVGVRRFTDGSVIGPDEMVQEVCQPPEITVDVFRARRQSRVVSVCRERLEVKAGVCTKARLFNDKEAEVLATRLGELLDLGGTYCFQIMRAAGGSWAIIDVNARPGGGTAMSSAVGVDVLAADLADLWGEDPSRFLSPLSRPRTVVRAYTEFVMD